MTFGPFETRAIDEADGVAETWHAAWRESQTEIDELRAELAATLSNAALLDARLRAAEERSR